jgi:hypothetical protein
MEWPMRMTRTEGSIVGEGVLDATSRSITLFWSLVLSECVGKLGDLPFFEVGYAFSQVAPCFEFGILDLEDVEVGQRVGE